MTKKYAIIDTGGKQLRVEPGRFYDIHPFTSMGLNFLKPNTKISLCRVLLICEGSNINLGHPWIRNAIVRGRVLHPCFDKKKIIAKIDSKHKTRKELGYRQNLIRFIVDSIWSNGKELVS
uniref:Large ribosomal subunit protein bL21c n=1 Tax=Crepidomanes minutum TaxID=32127 RepID=A0A8K1RVL0_9MONI|nr:ribosomal protein L21 [Crepidomanes minutum]UEQ13235.1 ribosomal protein L21 [Crepidomanes minutum]